MSAKKRTPTSRAIVCRQSRLQPGRQTLIMRRLPTPIVRLRNNGASHRNRLVSCQLCPEVSCSPATTLAPLHEQTSIISDNHVIHQSRAGKVNVADIAKHDPVHCGHTMPQQATNIATDVRGTLKRVVADRTDFLLPIYRGPQKRSLLVKKRSWYKIGNRLALVTMLVVFVASGIFMWRSNVIATEAIGYIRPTPAILGVKNSVPSLFQKEGDARINVLVLGLSNKERDGVELTDTIMVMSVDPVNSTATTIHVPQDLWVEVPGQKGAHQKINTIYALEKNQYIQKHSQTSDRAATTAGLDALDTVLEQVLGIPIQYHLRLNSAAFQRIVDVAGGITVSIPAPLVESKATGESGGDRAVVQAGTQQLDGNKALRYARSLDLGSDTVRSYRQQQIIAALHAKIKAMNTLVSPLKLEELAHMLAADMYTDMSSDDLLELYAIVQKIPGTAVYYRDIANTDHPLVVNDRIGDSTVTRPKLGYNQYSDIQTYIKTECKDGYLLKEHAALTVAAATKTGGNATASMLTRLGYTVRSVVIYPDISITVPSVIDLSKGKKPFTQHYLETRYDQHMSIRLPTNLLVPEQTDFVILVPR